MEATLNILILEDSLADVDLIERELRRGGIDFVSRVVKRREEFVDALNAFRPDVILSDHSLPQFNSIEAMEIWKAFQRQQQIVIPFILVTGSVSEEFAVQTIKAGADDYILKDRLRRLPSSVTAAVSKARLEAERQRHVAEMVAQTALMKEAEHLANFGSWKWDLRSQKLQWSDEAYRIYGFEPGEVEPSRETLLQRIYPEDRPVLEHLLQKAIDSLSVQQCEYRLSGADGKEKTLLSRILVKDDGNKAVELIGFTLDVTSQKEQTHELEMRNARLMEIAWVQSHQVRGPLARLMGLVQVLGHSADDINAIKETLPLITKSASELDEIVRKIVRKTEEIK